MTGETEKKKVINARRGGLKDTYVLSFMRGEMFVTSDSL